MYIGVDIGGTKISASLVSSRGLLKRNIRVPTPQGKKNVLATISNCINTLLSPRVKGIGIGVPGVVLNGKIPTLENIPGFKNFPIEQYFSKKYGLRVVAANDVDCFLMGENLFGVAKGAKNVLAFTVGTGFGSSVMIDGKLVGGTSGEISHACFGSTYHEKLIGGLSLEKRTKQSPKDLLRSKEKKHIKVVDALYERLTDIIALSGSLIDSDVVVLGGSLGRRLDSSRIRRLVTEKTVHPVKIKIVKQKSEHPSSVGAASLVMRT